jgi:hypothetical protein
MKHSLLVLTLVCLFAAPVAHGAEKQEELRAIANLVTERINSGNMTGMMQQLELYKEAGLSYQPALILPLVVDERSDEELNILLGMLTFDANYALVFGKLQESMETRAFIHDELLPRMQAYDKMDIAQPDQAIVESLLRDPYDAEARRQLNEHVTTQIRRNVEAAANDQELMIVFVESFYGAVIQGLFVASTLALDMPANPQLVALFNEQLTRLEFFDELVHNLQHSELRSVFGQEERCAIVDPLIAQLVAAQGALSPELVREVQDITAQARARYAYFGE